MQCRQIMGKTRGIKPSMMKWIYTAIMRPTVSYVCPGLAVSAPFEELLGGTKLPLRNLNAC